MLSQELTHAGSLLLQRTLMNINGMAAQIPIPTPQVGYWPRGLRLASPVPQKIKPQLPHEAAISLIAELCVSSCFVKSFILVLLAFFKCFISSILGFIFMKVLIFLIFWVRQLKPKVFIHTDIFLLADRSLTQLLCMLSASFI